MKYDKIANNYENVRWIGKKCYFGAEISFTTYILTDTKLITRSGFLNIREDEVELYRVVDKSLELPFTQRLFSCGTIKITAKDRDTPVKLVESIKKPRKFKHLLDSLVEAQRSKYEVPGRDMFGAASDLTSLY